MTDNSRQPCVLRSAAGATNQAGLVVKFGDGRTLTYCIQFAEESITGAELLRRSGLPVVMASSGGLGAAVCNIDGEGCTNPGDCFCKCRSGTCEYWAYFRQQDGAWQYSPIGAGARTIRNGDADAWVWGSGNTTPGAASADCAAAPSPTPQPTSTPRPPTATPVPPGRPTSVPAAAPSATALAQPANAQAPSPPPASQPGAAPPGEPVSGVEGAAVTPGSAQSPPASVATAASAASPASSPSPDRTALQTGTPPSGVIRVSDDEGHSNAAARSAGAWSWRSTLAFAAFAGLLLAAGAGALYWRRRAGE